MELLVVVGIAAIVGALGIVFGMLAAPRIGRLAARDDEETRDGTGATHTGDSRDDELADR